MLIIILIIILTLFCIINNLNSLENFINNSRLLVVVPLYNTDPLLLENCLKSIIKQNNKNYKVCIVDDASNKNVDNIHEIIFRYCNEYHNFHYIIKKENKGQIHSDKVGMEHLNPSDDDIILLVDGDDELYSNDVFTYIEDLYKNNDIYLTFGNYIKRINGTLKNKTNIKCDKDWNTISKNKLFRDIPFMFSHLKTFKYKLFKNIKIQDLMKDGKYIKSATDVAMMMPMLEMSGGKFKCVSKPLYIYNADNDNSHHNNLKTLKKQKSNCSYIKSLPKYQQIV